MSSWSCVCGAAVVVARVRRNVPSKPAFTPASLIFRFSGRNTALTQPQHRTRPVCRWRAKLNLQLMPCHLSVRESGLNHRADAMPASWEVICGDPSRPFSLRALFWMLPRGASTWLGCEFSEFVVPRPLGPVRCAVDLEGGASSEMS